MNDQNTALLNIIDWAEKIEYERKNGLLTDDRYEEVFDIIVGIAEESTLPQPEVSENLFAAIPIPDITITPEQFEHLQENYPYPDDGENCPECGTPLTHKLAEDIAYCDNCNFTIYECSDL